MNQIPIKVLIEALEALTLAYRLVDVGAQATGKQYVQILSAMSALKAHLNALAPVAVQVEA
jgi:hypothetical protein